MHGKTTALLLCILLLPSVTGVRAQEAQKRFITVLPLPCRDVPPPVHDKVLAGMARELRKQYRARVLSGRAVGRAVWGTLGSGLEEATMRFTTGVEDGKRAYQTLQIDDAIESMREARRQQVFCGPEVRDREMFINLNLYMGLAHLARGEQKEAAAAFRQAISHDPELTLSTQRFPPDVVQAFGSAKKDLMSEPPTRVGFVSKPEGATVFIDGERRGTTPLRGVRLYTGVHFVRLQLEGYSAWTLNLPDGVPPDEIKALLVPLWSGDPPEEILASAIATESMDESVLAQLRLLAGFFRAGALVMTSVARQGTDFHLGVRLFVVRPEKVARARLFNLGSDPDNFGRKIRGVVSTLKDLNSMAGAPVAVAGTGPPVGTGDGHLPVVGGTGGSGGSGGGGPVGGGGSGDGSGNGTRWYKSWWFWTAVGVVVAGGATGLALWLTQPESRWTLVVQPK